MLFVKFITRCPFSIELPHRNATSQTRDMTLHIADFSTGPTWPNIFPIVHDRDRFSNREQSGTNRSDENAMCDEYLRMCFRINEDSSRPFVNILRTLRTKQDS